MEADVSIVTGDVVAKVLGNCFISSPPSTKTTAVSRVVRNIPTSPPKNAVTIDVTDRRKVMVFSPKINGPHRLPVKPVCTATLVKSTDAKGLITVHAEP
jgi:hypothetical protein